MNPQEPYNASQVEPGWQICIDKQWLVVRAVIETETSDGSRHIWTFFEDQKRPAVRYLKTEEVPARPPDQPPEGSPGS